MGQFAEASTALAKAKSLREKLVGYELDGDDKIQDYDSLVSYYNK